MPIDVKEFHDLDAVAADAAGALDRAAQALPYDRLSWFRLTLAHCPPPGRLCVVRARDGDAAAWLFLMIDGGQARALASWYSLRVGCQTRGNADRCLPAIAANLARRRPAVHGFELAPVGAGAEALRRAFEHSGWIVRDEEGPANWSIAVAGQDFAGYWANRPGQLRSTVRRKQRGLAIAIATAFDADAWHAYEQVYAASWKPPEGSSALLRALAEQEGAAGTLRLGVARDADGRPLAAQLWLVENGIATIHKLAHVADADARSPGTILSAAMFGYVIGQDRPERIDFGTGDDAYKRDWMDERRLLRRLVFYNRRTIAGRGKALRDSAAVLVRRWRSG